MSEYQYYEFLALDRPLTAKQRAELRSISSRAEITATRFTNEYRWGDLKGDPLQMVKEYRHWRSGREVRLSSGNGSVSCVRGTTASRACRNGLIRRACRADELAAGQWRSPRVRSARVTVTAKGRSAANDPEVAAARA